MGPDFHCYHVFFPFFEFSEKAPGHPPGRTLTRLNTTAGSPPTLPWFWFDPTVVLVRPYRGIQPPTGYLVFAALEHMLSPDAVFLAPARRIDKRRKVKKKPKMQTAAKRASRVGKPLSHGR